jgi:hypothetical protein
VATADRPTWALLNQRIKGPVFEFRMMANLIVALAALSPALALAFPHPQGTAQSMGRRLLRFSYWAAKSQGDMPDLPPERGPNGSAWDNSLAVCTSMHKENSTDVREWLLYHKCVSYLSVLSSVQDIGALLEMDLNPRQLALGREN